MLRLLLVRFLVATALLSFGAGGGPGHSQEGAEAPARPRFDVLLSGGRVMDGSGNPWFYADVAVRDGRVVAIGRLTGSTARRVLDVRGRFVVPGFIDLHSHADGPGGERRGLRAADVKRRAAVNLVCQGISTVVVNQDGRSPASIAGQRNQLESRGFGPNVALMVGHNSIRHQAMGADFRRLATSEELARMVDLVHQGMQAGAHGLTAGLEYVPGRWSDKEELVSLVEAVKPYGGIYVVHERASGHDPMWFWPSQHEAGQPTMLHSILETIEVAERTEVPTVATHVKIRGSDYWGSGGAIVQLIENARSRGVEIWADQYPYNTTGSDGSTVLIPEWALELDRSSERPSSDEDSGRRENAYAAALRQVLQDREKRIALERDITREISRRGGAENIFFFEYPDAALVGKSLAQVSASRGLSVVELAIQLQLEGFPQRPGGARLRGFSLSEIDVETLAAQPWTATASDAGVALPEDGPVHARFYGTYPRKIREYAVRRGVLSVESAIRSATSLPAQILGLVDRGLVREGFYADLVVLDLNRLRDRATFQDPHQYPEGVEYVMINGELVVEQEKPTLALPGVVITPAAGRRGTTSLP